MKLDDERAGRLILGLRQQGVTDARVLRANPPRVFDREALNAVKRWRFEPISSPTTTRRTLAFQPNN